MFIASERNGKSAFVMGEKNVEEDFWSNSLRSYFGNPTNKELDFVTNVKNKITWLRIKNKRA